jgi:site-specific DNA recombinase
MTTRNRDENSNRATHSRRSGSTRTTVIQTQPNSVSARWWVLICMMAVVGVIVLAVRVSFLVETDSFCGEETRFCAAQPPLQPEPSLAYSVRFLRSNSRTRRKHQDELKPRNGKTLIVYIIARISGCANQRELSLDDQADHAKEIISDMYDGSVEFRVIATKGKGERLDRPELDEIRQHLLRGEADVLIMEDLGRLVRGVEAVRLFGIAVDHGTRAMSPNDHVDTINDTWEEDALAACRDHVAHNSHTSRRLKHKLMNRFEKFGGAMALPIAGYVVPDDATTYDRWKKDEQWTEMIREGAQLLTETRNCCIVADYFNRCGFPVGPYCRNRRWDGKMVRRYFKNPLLKGVAMRGHRRTEKHHETGRRVARKNPNPPTEYLCPHLAFFSPQELDELNALLAFAHKNLGRKHVNGRDPRAFVPKTQSRFPGGAATCWYCGHIHVWGGNGISENLMCSAARDWGCWCSIGFNGALLTRKILATIWQALEALPGLDDQMRSLIDQAQRGGPEMERQWAQLIENERQLAQRKQHLASAIVEEGMHDLLREKVGELKMRDTELAQERRKLERLHQVSSVIPANAAELAEKIKATLTTLDASSFELADVLRLLVPECHVYLVRLCDGGHLLPRTRVRLQLEGLVPEMERVPGLSALLRQVKHIDLFDPPQRERIRVEAVTLSARGLTAAKVADIIKERPTKTAVLNALMLNARMQELGLSDPYTVVTETPIDYPKLRRHLNARYRFTPRPGYTPPSLT